MAQDHGQPQDQPAAQPHGVPYDWSHHHLIFSNPGTAEDAMRKGTYDHWFHTVNDPRYQQDQVRRHRHQEPNDWQREWGRRREADSGGLWGQSLGSINAAVGAGMYPAKFSFDSNTLNCANATEPDYVVYNTSVAPSASQASVIAFDNIYTTTCTPSTAVPTVYWSYNTGGTVSTSVTLSEDGYQAAFVQSVGSKATLVILKYKGGQGASATSAVLPDSVTTAGATYATCRTGTTSCELELQFANVGTPTPATPNDTNSPPFYNYNADTLWVGDNSGYLHKFTGVFKGTPAEATTGGWPVYVIADPNLTSTVLTGPVYDSTSGLIFVNDASGYLHSVNATTPTGSLASSVQMECGTGFQDPPIVDSTAEEVYVFVAYGCDGPPGNSYINKFAAGAATPINSGTGYGTALSFGNASNTTNPNTSVARDGSFDNTYYAGNGTTGNLYYCEDGRVYKISAAAFTEARFSTLVSTRNNTSDCSGITEFYGTSATTTLRATMNPGNGNTTASVVSTSGFTVPTTGTYYVQIDSEMMAITAVNSTGAGSPSLSVTRGQLGTSFNVSHAAGAAVNEVHDWLFLSVLGNGSPTTPCTGSCLYNYDVLANAATGTPVAGLQVVGGTSGISIDNSALNGGSQIYFTFGSSATGGPGGVHCPPPSNATTGGCAVQATQLGLN
jgi:hypothetical protein